MSNKVTWNCQKVDGTFFTDRRNQQIESEFDAQAPDGFYVCTKARQLPDKSHKQVKTVFGLVIGHTLAAFDELGYDTSYLIKSSNPSGVEVSPELMKEYLYSVCPIFNEDGERVTLSKMDVAQATKFINDVRDYISAEWGIYIPDPDKDYKKKTHHFLRTIL